MLVVSVMELICRVKQPELAVWHGPESDRAPDLVFERGIEGHVSATVLRGTAPRILRRSEGVVKRRSARMGTKERQWSYTSEIEMK